MSSEPGKSAASSTADGGGSEGDVKSGGGEEGGGEGSVEWEDEDVFRLIAERQQLDSKDSAKGKSKRWSEYVRKFTSEKGITVNEVFEKWTTLEEDYREYKWVVRRGGYDADQKPVAEIWKSLLEDRPTSERWQKQHFRYYKAMQRYYAVTKKPEFDNLCHNGRFLYPGVQKRVPPPPPPAAVLERLQHSTISIAVAPHTASSQAVRRRSTPQRTVSSASAGPLPATPNSIHSSAPPVPVSASVPLAQASPSPSSLPSAEAGLSHAVSSAVASLSLDSLSSLSAMADRDQPCVVARSLHSLAGQASEDARSDSLQTMTSMAPTEGPKSAPPLPPTATEPDISGMRRHDMSGGRPVVAQAHRLSDQSLGGGLDETTVRELISEKTEFDWGAQFAGDDERALKRWERFKRKMALRGIREETLRDKWIELEEDFREYSWIQQRAAECGRPFSTVLDELSKERPQVLRWKTMHFPYYDQMMQYTERRNSANAAAVSSCIVATADAVGSKRALSDTLQQAPDEPDPKRQRTLPLSSAAADLDGMTHGETSAAAGRASSVYWEEHERAIASVFDKILDANFHNQTPCFTDVELRAVLAEKLKRAQCAGVEQYENL